MLAHSTEKLQEYELLTQPRSLEVYETIRRSNNVPDRLGDGGAGR